MDDNIICYMAAMAIAGRMLSSGTITRKEFLVFEEKMRLKCGDIMLFGHDTGRALKLPLITRQHNRINAVRMPP